MVIKQQRQLVTSTTHLAQKLLINFQCSVASASFHRGREPWRWGAYWPAIGSWQWPAESDIKADPLTTTREVAEELNIDHSIVIWHLKQIGKTKKLDKRVLHKLTANLKTHHFEVLSSSILPNKINHFLIGLWHATKSGFYKTTRDDHLTGWTEKLQSTSQSQTWMKQRSWSLFGGLLPVWPTTAFWILTKHYIWEVCSANWWENCNDYSWYWSTEQAQFSTTRTDSTSYNQCFKSWMNWAMKFASSAIFTWPLANYHFFKDLNSFLQVKCFHNQEDEGNPLVVHLLGLCASNAGGISSISGQGTKISHALRHLQKKKEYAYSL